MAGNSVELLASLISALEAEVDSSCQGNNGTEGPRLLDHLRSHPEVMRALDLYNRRPAVKRASSEDSGDSGSEPSVSSEPSSESKPSKAHKSQPRQRAAPINFEEKKIRLAHLLVEFKRRFHDRMAISGGPMRSLSA